MAGMAATIRAPGVAWAEAMLAAREAVTPKVKAILADQRTWRVWRVSSSMAVVATISSPSMANGRA